ncbi:translesion error-prone DNA polymerase V autoproteolytic subunit [Bacteroidota bacterium]|nr:translesion error-prone DNA polymerase V autoproteolytic subunit [Bacteroidota bacterium]
MYLKYLRKSNDLEVFSIDQEKSLDIPFFDNQVPAGFPSPAQDYIDLDLDLHNYLVKNPSSTFCVRVTGESMRDAGINSGDVMLVDRSLDPKNRSIVLAVVDNEFTVKRVNVSEEGLFLMPENADFNPIKITSEMNFQVWGVVTYIIHKAN